MSLLNALELTAASFVAPGRKVRIRLRPINELFVDTASLKRAILFVLAIDAVLSKRLVYSILRFQNQFLPSFEDVNMKLVGSNYFNCLFVSFNTLV